MPGRVTVPTPSPGRNRTPGMSVRDGGKNGVAVRDIRVVSGIFGNPQVQLSLVKVHELTGRVTVSPSGRVIVAECCGIRERRPSRAARVAAVAHEPVVNPLRRG